MKLVIMLIIQLVCCCGGDCVPVKDSTYAQIGSGDGERQNYSSTSSIFHALKSDVNTDDRNMEFYLHAEDDDPEKVTLEHQDIVEWLKNLNDKRRKKMWEEHLKRGRAATSDNSDNSSSSFVRENQSVPQDLKSWIDDPSHKVGIETTPYFNVTQPGDEKPMVIEPDTKISSPPPIELFIILGILVIIPLLLAILRRCYNINKEEFDGHPQRCAGGDRTRLSKARAHCKRDLDQETLQIQRYLAQQRSKDPVDRLSADPEREKETIFVGKHMRIFRYAPELHIPPDVNSFAMGSSRLPRPEAKAEETSCQH
ncbi:uncharacterized protein LOC108679873 isoform X2 [Hyalella azteca]|uniref:Uncharacterized protein LOC108679873 isoform X2 n=1 Tax=Hyalella azteca TaxID=294128 RepID=A0A8B7PD72_HYAAZ|nr:uncharacterized protein LOC108679873 isoform X2 [Hyalella azteca]